MKIINLTSGNIALVSDQDFEKVNKLRWRSVSYTRNGKQYIYAKHFEKNKKTLLLHVYIYGEAAKNRTVFLDGNNLNFQRENIKIVKFNHEK